MWKTGEKNCFVSQGKFIPSRRTDNSRDNNNQKVKVMEKNQSIGYMDVPVPKDVNLKEAIDQLRKEKNAVILAHYYQTGEDRKSVV